MLKTRTARSKSLTKADLTAALRHLHDGVRSEIRQSTREVVSHFTEGQSKQDRRLQQIEHDLTIVNTKLDAIMSGEVLVTRRQFQRLLRILKSRGIEFDESEVLAA